MADAKDTYARAQALLAEGKVQEAADLLKTAQNEAEAEEAARLKAEADANAPDSDERLLYSILHGLSARCGHPPGVQELLEEFERRLLAHESPAPPASAEPPATSPAA